MPYRLTVDALCPNGLEDSSDSFRLIIRDRVYMFEIYAFQILRLLTKFFNSLFSYFFTNIDRSGPSTAPRG